MRSASASRRWRASTAPKSISTAIRPGAGPRAGAAAARAAHIPDLSQILAQLARRADLRESQLAALENVILTRELKEEIHPEGRPVTTGYISSYFGERADPFAAREAFH